MGDKIKYQLREWYLRFGDRPVLWSGVVEPIRKDLRDAYYSDFVDYVHRDSYLLTLTPEALEIIKG